MDNTDNPVLKPKKDWRPGKLIALRHTLMRKANSFHKKSNAQVFVAIKIKNRYYVYTSARKPSPETIRKIDRYNQKKRKWPEFPPPLHHIVSPPGDILTDNLTGFSDEPFESESGMRTILKASRMPGNSFNPHSARWLLTRFCVDNLPTLVCGYNPNCSGTLLLRTRPSNRTSPCRALPARFPAAMSLGPPPRTTARKSWEGARNTGTTADSTAISRRTRVHHRSTPAAVTMTPPLPRTSSNLSMADDPRLTHIAATTMSALPQVTQKNQKAMRMKTTRHLQSAWSHLMTMPHVPLER